MDFGLPTGDQSDNQQLNETLWVRQLVEGGQVLDPNSGKGSFEGTTCTPLDQAALMAKYPNLDAEAARYTGVQDYDDLPSTRTTSTTRTSRPASGPPRAGPPTPG